MTETILEYFRGDDLAASVFQGKYALKHKKKAVETLPSEMHRRLSEELARIEGKFQELDTYGAYFDQLSEFGQELSTTQIDADYIFTYLDRFRYIVPQGSIMSMLGNPYAIGSLSNCFVIPAPVDSYGGIFYADQQLAQLMKRRAGVGLNLNELRPDDTPVNNAAGTSTGAHSFMNRYSNTTREVAQNGRRGALMLLMSVIHPDIFKFVTKKKDRTQVTGANISVQLTNKFMKAAETDGDFYCKFPITVSDRDVQHELESRDINSLPYNACIEMSFGYVMRIRAKELYDLIIEMAWENAEPGIAFMDNVIEYSPDGVYKQFLAIASNPCGEQWLQAYDSCRLLALNLYSVVVDAFMDSARIDWQQLYEISYLQQRFADNIVELEIEYVDKIITKIKKDKQDPKIKATELDLWEKVKETATASRRTGCGFTALGDMLAALGLKYDSPEALEIIQEVMRVKMQAELDCTIDLAISRGTFEGWDKKSEFYVDSNGDLQGANSFYQMLLEEFPEATRRMCDFGRRNVSWSTVAPTGTVSLMTQTTSGLEPLFALFYMRRKKVNPSDEGVRVDFVDQSGDAWTEYPVLHPKFLEWMRLNSSEEDVLQALDGNKAVLNHLAELSPWFGSTANDIDWVQRVEIQAIIQRYTTNAISSTINLPSTVSKEKVSEIYMAAWKHGLKGVTVYRDGSRTGVLVTEKKDEFHQHNAPKRPKNLPCKVYSTTSKGIRYNVIVGVLNDLPYEVFATPHFTNDEDLVIVKKGKGKYNLTHPDGELHTEDFLSDLSDEEATITRLLSTSLRHGAALKYVVEQLNKVNGNITSFTKAIARVLKRHIPENDLAVSCTDCGGTNIRYEEGCAKCTDCGSSKCG